MERAGNPTPNVLLMLSMALGRGGSCTWQRQAFGLGERTLPRSSPRVNITSKSPRPALPSSPTEVNQRCRPEDAQRLTAAGRTARHWRRGSSAQLFEARRRIARYPNPLRWASAAGSRPTTPHPPTKKPGAHEHGPHSGSSSGLAPPPAATSPSEACQFRGLPQLREVGSSIVGANSKGVGVQGPAHAPSLHANFDALSAGRPRHVRSSHASVARRAHFNRASR